jgi:HlyD family secretion protein
MKQKVRPKLFIIALGAGILVVTVGSTAMLKKPKPIPAEKIVTAEKGDVARSVVARGKIEPLSKVEVKSKANGIIQALLVDVGDSVKEGQVLAELDKADLQAQVREAKATLDGEKANLEAAVAAESKARIEAANPELEFARRDSERAEGLFKQKIASEQQLDDANRAYEVAKNRRQLLTLRKTMCSIAGASRSSARTCATSFLAACRRLAAKLRSEEFDLPSSVCWTRKRRSATTQLPMT